jgi:DNA-binding response OmpR family regulator
LEKAQSGKADLMVLDVMLPELNGFEVLRRLRKTSALPVIMLTARDDVMDKVAGLDGGADDYMTKPFAIEELLARIRLALKKKTVQQQAAYSSLLVVGKLQMDVGRYEVYYDNNKIELTHREFELLKVLMKNKNLVITRDTLLEKVCGYDYMGETNVIDVYVRYIRSKIDDVYKVKIIQTVRGVGYCIKED